MLWISEFSPLTSSLRYLDPPSETLAQLPGLGVQQLNVDGDPMLSIDDQLIARPLVDSTSAAISPHDTEEEAVNTISRSVEENESVELSPDSTPVEPSPDNTPANPATAEPEASPDRGDCRGSDSDTVRKSLLL